MSPPAVPPATRPATERNTRLAERKYGGRATVGSTTASPHLIYWRMKVEKS